MDNWNGLDQRFGGYSEQEFVIPSDIDLMNWIHLARPTIDNRPYSFQPFPMWVDIIEDLSHQAMVMAGRQVFKSTWFSNLLAHLATTQKESVGVYCTYDDISLSAYSSQKYREQTLNKNPLIRNMCDGKKTGLPGRVGEVRFKNGAVSYLVTDESQYTHVEGKSPNLVVMDEIQYQELEHLEIVYEAMATTIVTTGAKLRMAGIGGEEGSELQRLWHKTTQSYWKYKDKFWYDKLKYDNVGRLFVDDYLDDVLDGKWIMKEPRNRDFPGYWLPQTIFPHIPHKIIDAIKRKLPIKYSIQYKEMNYPRSRYLSHVMGTFYEAQRRPITEAMIRACMEPYSYLSLIRPDGLIDSATGLLEEILEIKAAFGKLVKILMGVDYGSGKSGLSATVPMIIIKWKGRQEGEDRYHVVWVERLPPMNPDDEAELLADYHKMYGVDVGCGDLGHGANIIKKMQVGGYNRLTGHPWTGVGNLRFIGTRTVGREAQKLEFKERDVDESGEEVQQIILDKTQILDDYVSFIQWYVPHPLYPLEEALRRPKLMIPFANERDVHWMIKDMSALIRKDLEQVIDVEVVDERQHVRKEYNHPKDVVVSLSQCLVADQQPEPSYDVGGVYTSSRGGSSPTERTATKGWGRGRLR